MQSDRNDLIEAYLREVQSLWTMALTLHGCSLCAARDLEEKAIITAGELGTGDKKGLGCMEVCTDGRTYARSLYKPVMAAGGAVRRAVGGSAILLMVMMSSQLVRTWQAGAKLSDCPECVLGALVHDVGLESLLVSVDIGSGAVEGIAESCVHCRVPLAGLV
jgi:hypothetical protein